MQGRCSVCVMSYMNILLSCGKSIGWLILTGSLLMGYKSSGLYWLLYLNKFRGVGGARLMKDIWGITKSRSGFLCLSNMVLCNMDIGGSALCLQRVSVNTVDCKKQMCKCASVQLAGTLSWLCVSTVLISKKDWECLQSVMKVYWWY